ncbi:MAG: hypothetical protein ACXAEX_23505 [Promethearchaeota archaeon]|jgi:hypothetical protein
MWLWVIVGLILVFLLIFSTRGEKTGILIINDEDDDLIDELLMIDLDEEEEE